MIRKIGLYTALLTIAFCFFAQSIGIKENFVNADSSVYVYYSAMLLCQTSIAIAFMYLKEDEPELFEDHLKKTLKVLFYVLLVWFVVVVVLNITELINIADLIKRFRLK